MDRVTATCRTESTVYEFSHGAIWQYFPGMMPLTWVRRKPHDGEQFWSGRFGSLQLSVVAVYGE